MNAVSKSASCFNRNLLEMPNTVVGIATGTSATVSGVGLGNKSAEGKPVIMPEATRGEA